MPILTTKKISRKKLEEIINFGKEKKLISDEKATDLTNSVNRHITANYKLWNQGKLTIGDMRRENKINLTADELQQLIKIQKERITHHKEKEMEGVSTYIEVLYYAGLVLNISILFMLFIAFLGAAATGGATILLTLGFVACVGTIMASYYGLSSLYCRSALENTLATLKKFVVPTNDAVRTAPIPADENSSEHQLVAAKTRQSPNKFFAAAPPAQNANNATEQGNAPQHKLD